MCTVNWQPFESEELVLITLKLFPQIIFLNLKEMPADITGRGRARVRARASEMESGKKTNASFVIGFHIRTALLLMCRCETLSADNDVIWRSHDARGSPQQSDQRLPVAWKVEPGWESTPLLDWLNELSIMIHTLWFGSTSTCVLGKSNFRVSQRQHASKTTRFNEEASIWVKVETPSELFNIYQCCIISETWCGGGRQYSGFRELYSSPLGKKEKGKKDGDE